MNWQPASAKHMYFNFNLDIDPCWSNGLIGLGPHTWFNPFCALLAPNPILVCLHQPKFILCFAAISRWISLICLWTLLGLQSSLQANGCVCLYHFYPFIIFVGLLYVGCYFCFQEIKIFCMMAQSSFLCQSC